MARPRLEIGTYGKIRTYELGPKSWRAMTKYRDEDGVTRPVEKRAESEAKAVRKLKNALKDRRPVTGNGELTSASLFQVAGEMWLAEQERTNVGSTYDRYRTLLRNRMIPEFAGLSLHEVSTSRSHFYLRELEKRLAPNTVRQYRTVLSGVMGFAVQMGALDRNPVEGAGTVHGGNTRATKRALTPEEREDFLAKLDADKRAVQDDLPDVLRYMLGTGVRLGEVMGLRWMRVDLEEGVSVHGDNLVRETKKCLACKESKRRHRAEQCPSGDTTWVEPPEGTYGLLLHEPKTEAGFRVLPLPDFVLLMLQLRYPGPGCEDAPVFPSFPTYPVQNATERRSSRSGRRVGEKRLHPYRPTARDGGLFVPGAWRDPNNTDRSIRKFREAAGYVWFTSHVCRRTAATILDEQGLTPREISGYIGHARPSFTQDNYMDPKQQSRAAGKGLDAAMRPRRPVSKGQ